MAKKEKEILDKLKKKRDLAIEFRKQRWDCDAETALNYYYYGTHEDLGDVSVDDKKRRQRKANYVFSTIESIIPKMFDRVPGFQLLPRGEDDLDKAPIVEQVLRYKVEQVDFEQKAEDASRDMLTVGMGVFKVFWDFAEDEDGNTTRDTVGLEVIDPWDFYITAGDLRVQDAQGVFQCMKITMSDAEERYPKAKKLDKAEKVIVGDLNATKRENFKDQAERIVVWEYHGKIKGKETVVVFTDAEVIQERDPYEHGRRPFIILPNYRLAREFYCRGDVYHLQPLQEELREIDLQMSNFRKVAINPKLWHEPGVFADQVNRSRARDPRPNLVEVKSISRLKWQSPPPIGGDLYNMRSIKKEDMSLMSGINEISRGGTERVVKTATGQQILFDAAEGRVRQKVRAVSRAMKEMLFQMQGLLAQFQDTEDAVRITDNETPIFEGYTKEDIQGSFDIMIDVVETMPILREKRGQLALDAYATFKDDPSIDQIALKKKVAKLAFQDIGAEELVIEGEEPLPETLIPNEAQNPAALQAEQFAGLVPDAL